MKKEKSKSIRTYLLWPLFALLLLQAAVMAGMLLFGGVSIKLKTNAVHLLSENTENSRLYLERETIHQWMGMISDSSSMAPEIEAVLEEEQADVSAIRTDPEINRRIVEGVLEKSVDLLRRGRATGVFLVLDGPAAENSPEGTQAGFYIRDSKVGGYRQDYSALLMERGLPSIANQYGIPLDSFWELGFHVSGEDERNNFYRKPFDSAVVYHAEPGAAINFSYLSRPFRLSPRDMEVITYSSPIILSNGAVVGVFGLAMSSGQLEQELGSERPDGIYNVSYCLGIREAGETYITPVAAAGYPYHQYFGSQSRLDFIEEEDGVVSLCSQDGTKWLGVVKGLDLYGYNTPFETDEWVLLGLAKRTDVLSFYNTIRRMLLGAMLVSVFLSLVGVCLIGKVVTDPIRELAGELSRKSGESCLSLKRVNINEIDELTATIETLSADVERSASKISSILEHTDVRIGVFEYQKDTKNVFCSRSLYELLGWGELNESYCYLPEEAFGAAMRETLQNGRKEGEATLFYVSSDGREQWVRMILDEGEAGAILGVLTDVTADRKEREKLERERNYDLLTDLYNRRAFKEKTQQAMQEKAFELAAVVMWDLDNLKYINDTYGHDEGDRYIATFAGCLRRFEEKGALVSRYAGDEFVTFLYGNQGKEEIRGRIAGFMKDLQKSVITMEGGREIPIRVSGGYAWYPTDAEDFDTLFTYADFAMYTIKHSVKGSVREFDRNAYENNSYILSGREDLNRMLETDNVHFAFQPIVTRTGGIFGYELLMRPDFTHMKGVEEALTIAKSQAKLPQIEATTWRAGLAAVARQDEMGHICGDERFFINSIASVCMTEADVAALTADYGKYLSRVVMEMTEGEPVNREYMNRKIAMTREWGALVALDDFGAGYNSESVLLDMKPNIIKVDMSLITSISMDENRQMLLRNLMNFARKNQMRILAEGVETPEELRFLIENGVELFQGYYIARPNPDIRPLDPYIIAEMKNFSEKSRFS